MPDLSNFRWFDRPAVMNQGAFTPSQPGALSILGETLQGIAEPFAAAHGVNFPQTNSQNVAGEFENFLRLQQLGLQREELDVKESELLDTQVSRYTDLIDALSKKKSLDEAIAEYRKERKSLAKTLRPLYSSVEALDADIQESLQERFAQKVVQATAPTPSIGLGQKTGEMLRAATINAPVLPVAGIQRLLNFASGVAQGSTGIQTPVIPPQFTTLESLRQGAGELFNVPGAVDFYRQAFERWRQNRPLPQGTP